MVKKLKLSQKIEAIQVISIQGRKGVGAEENVCTCLHVLGIQENSRKIQPG